MTTTHRLKDGRTLLIREATPADAPDLLSYIAHISGETAFLSFGPGEFELDEAAQARALAVFRDTPNQCYYLGFVDDTIATALFFKASQRPRLRHTGEFGISVRKLFWRLGIGSLMLDLLLAWARDTHIIKKINLRVRTDNHRAIALYERKDFVHEGTLRHETCIDGVFYDIYWMGYVLHPE